MSDITIEAPKQKRSYTRKPKVSEPVPEPVPEPVEEVISSPESIILEPSVAIAKRKYTRKPKSPVDETIAISLGRDDPIPQPELSRQTNEPVSVPEKKPRTDKQIAAFNRMRQARIEKQAELESLREFAKEKEKFDKESAKVEKMEEKIVSKASRKPRAPKKLVEEEYEPEPQPIVKVSNIRPIMFM
jgi:hypothetical protein